MNELRIGDRVRVKLYRYEFIAYVTFIEHIGDQIWVTVSNGSRFHSSYLEKLEELAESL